MKYGGHNMINNPVIGLTRGGSSLSGLREVTAVAGVAENGELHMQGNFCDVKLFEVVE